MHLNSIAALPLLASGPAAAFGALRSSPLASPAYLAMCLHTARESISAVLISHYFMTGSETFIGLCLQKLIIHYSKTLIACRLGQPIIVRNVCIQHTWQQELALRHNYRMNVWDRHGENVLGELLST